MIKDTEPIEIDELISVNTFSRMEVLQQKTRELTHEVSAFAEPKDHKYFLDRLNEFDNLAIDWVNGGELDWEGSLPDLKSKEISDEINKIMNRNPESAS